jgi:hypothetical protein
MKYATKNTVAIHLWDKSWFTRRDWINAKIKGITRRSLRLLKRLTGDTFKGRVINKG